MTVCIADAPRADDLVLAKTVASGGRRHACRGGLKARKKAKMDGRRDGGGAKRGISARIE